MVLDGYEQAIEVMNKAFKVNEGGEFETMLGGAVKARSQRLDYCSNASARRACYSTNILRLPCNIGWLKPSARLITTRLPPWPRANRIKRERAAAPI